MRANAPEGFSLDVFLHGIYAFQKWELFPGHITSGPKDVLAHAGALGIPENLEGLRVLDIAPWNGFFGFECARRGAREIISYGPDDPNLTGYNKVRDLLEIENCKYIRGSVYDLSPEVHGTFDIVLFLGLIYHLRHPLLALDRIYDVAEKRLFVDSPIIDLIVFDTTISSETKQGILTNGSIMHELPMLYFTKGKETGDPYNWFMPNRRALRGLVESSGFVIDRFVDDGGGWASLSANKGSREFVVGLEGWNPDAAKA